MGQLVYVIRKRIKLGAEKAIFIFVKNVLPPTGKQQQIYLIGHWFGPCHLSLRLKLTGFAGAMMSTIYEEHKDEDGFLYMTYSGENTFGESPPAARAGGKYRDF